ncbi:MAG: tetratricopeptide repeat protein [Pseudomonadota bacterium]
MRSLFHLFSTWTTTFIIFLTGLLLLLPKSSIAATKVFSHTVDQPFSGSQSPDDAYMAAITRAKFEVLELAGTYLESLSVVENAILTKDEVTALAGGVLTTEVVKKKNYANDKTFGIRLSTRIEVNTDILHQRMDKLLQDRTLLHKYNEIQVREQELLARIKQLEEAARSHPDADLRPNEFNNEFSTLSAALTASEWLEKAIALWSKGRFSEPAKAVSLLSQAIALDANNPRTYNSRAVAYLNMGKLNEAEKDLNTALTENPSFADAHNNMGSLHYRRGDYQAAITSYTLAIQNQPDYVEAIINRGMASRKLFNFERAFEDFHRAMVLSPTAFKKSNDAGVLVELNDIDQMCEKSYTACRMGMCKSLDFLKQRGFCLEEKTYKINIHEMVEQ